MTKKKNRNDQILEAAKSALRGIERHKGDLEQFIESEGLRLERTDIFPENINASIYGNTIFVKRDKEHPLLERLHILHELGHHFLHSLCIGHYQTDMIMVVKQEKEAETFASLVLHPSVDGYETEKEFAIKSGLPKHTVKLRINFFRKTGI